VAVRAVVVVALRLVLQQVPQAVVQTQSVEAFRRMKGITVRVAAAGALVEEILDTVALVAVKQLILTAKQSLGHLVIQQEFGEQYLDLSSQQIL
jgi:hypothetical protein